MKATRKIFSFLLLPCLFSINLSVIAQKQSREINKIFQISQGGLLEIENKFGDIDILKWEKPEVSISVKLSANARNDAAASNMIDKISIEIDKENGTIKARTVLNNESGMSQGNSFSVNYTINVPIWVNLNVINKFGNIHIDDISGLVNIDLKHGNLRILSLSRSKLNPLNQIGMAYSDGVIDNAGSVKLDLSFSKIEIESAVVIVAETKYSGINANSCNSFKVESKYDNFKFDKVQNLEGILQYSNLHIGEFSGAFEMESTFSGVKIDQVLPAFESINITNERGSYKIGVHPETCFDLYANSERGDISVTGFSVVEKKSEGISKYIHATNGTEGKGKPINISTEDGSVSVFKL
jgi:hypothetical protein